MRNRPRRLVVMLGLLGLVLGSACTTPSGGRASPSAASTATRSFAPLARSTDRPVDPEFDFGQDILITEDAFVPRELIAAVGFPITWRNESSRTQQIHFDNNGDISSELISPGGSWVFTPTVTVSIVYHSIVDPSMRGSIQIQPLTEP